jgi:hypothetical protein
MTMTHPDPKERLASAVAAVERASLHLIAPSSAAMEECRQELDAARNLLQPLAISPPSLDPAAQTAMRDRARTLRKSLARTQGLLDHAADFYAGWARLRNTLTGGYTAAGAPAEVAAGGGQLSVEG